MNFAFSEWAAGCSQLSAQSVRRLELCQERGDILATREGLRMQGRKSPSSTRRLLVWALALSAMLMADAAFAERYAVGDEIEPFTLQDQHGESRTVDASVKVILFSRDMEGGDFLKQGLADVAPEYLNGKKAV